MELPKSGREARSIGVPKYFTGKPCARGHISDRYSYNGACIACQNEHISAYRKTPLAKASQRSYYVRMRVEAPEVIMWRSARFRAKRFNVPFAIDPSDVKSAWPADGLCPILGVKLRHNFDGAGSHAKDSPSLDRIVPAKGYVRGNIVVISQNANLLKSDETDPAVFRRIADWLDSVKGA